MYIFQKTNNYFLAKQESYSVKTSKLLDQYSILKLAPNGNELFGRSWGKKLVRKKI